MGTTQIKEWYNRFKDGRLSVERNHAQGGPQHRKKRVPSLNQVRNLVMQKRESRSENL
ncbi:Uncharacterized protein FKW44_022456 [Caligus rogercresseyi]|uniref:Uncharacterized protein n=1 Tax=Caligus rogercresseyi TaxID=217165 RepID=A0A7T8GMF7_CALRO|nr:Uncharacterized protein FKW44_022456 [Caligus rogercresseyi]